MFECVVYLAVFSLNSTSNLMPPLCLHLVSKGAVVNDWERAVSLGDRKALNTDAGQIHRCPDEVDSVLGCGGADCAHITASPGTLRRAPNVPLTTTEHEIRQLNIQIA